MPTKIEWTHRPRTTGVTWNIVSGCTKISEGCLNCYAERMSHRLAGRFGYPADDPFRVTVHPDRLEGPLRWKKPRTVFVCSMGDLFHEDVPEEYIDRVVATAAYLPWHTFLLLTKRPERMREYFASSPNPRELPTRRDAICEAVWVDIQNENPMYSRPIIKWPIPNLWLGVTAENQKRADERIPILLQIPAAVRFVSVEPMLGAMDVLQWLGDHHSSLHGGFDRGLDWVICGGETGPGARPIHPDWVRSLRDECVNADIPFFFKRWGNGNNSRLVDGREWNQWPDAS